MSPKARALLYDRSPKLQYLIRPLLWGGLHLYAARPLLGAAAALGMSRLAGWLVVLVMPLISLLPFQTSRDESIGRRALLHWIGYATMSFVAILLVLVMGSDSLRLIQWMIRLGGHAAAIHLPLLDLRVLYVGIVALAGFLWSVGLFQARRPRTHRVSVPIADLPAELEGYRIVQLSDVHVGPTIRRQFVQNVVQQVNALEPDLVAITGDLIDAYVDEVGDDILPLASLKALDGTFYVTGNHEYYWRASEWIPRLESVGLRFLKNDHVVIARGAARLAIAGVTDPVGRGTHRPDLPQAVDGIGADVVTVLLSHRPQTAAAASRRGVDVQLSGHTHGGQFFPFNYVIRFFQPIVAGLHRVGSTWLYVNRGTGYWGPPSRLGVGGEITLLELTRG